MFVVLCFYNNGIYFVLPLYISSSLRLLRDYRDFPQDKGKALLLLQRWIFMKDTVSRESNGLHSPDDISYFMCTSSSTWVAEH